MVLLAESTGKASSTGMSTTLGTEKIEVSGVIYLSKNISFVQNKEKDQSDKYYNRP